MKKTKTKLGPMDFILFSNVMLLVSIGVIMVFSASAYIVGHGASKDYLYFLKKQFLAAVFGTIAMIFAQRYDYHKIKKYTGILMLITAILLFVVLLTNPVNGAKRWIPLGPAGTLQPSEVAKYVVVLYMAKSMENKGENIKSFFYGILPFLLVSGFYAAVILIEPSMSIASVIMFVTIIMLFSAGAKIQQLFLLIFGVGGVGYYFIVSEPFRYKRFISFLHPFSDRQGTGFQLVQSLLAIGSGGILGVGLGRSRQKAYFLPEPHNDFIFSVIGEELGLIGCIFIIALFLVFIWRGISVAINAKDTYGNLLGIGITSVIAVQAIINIAVVTGSIPVTGVPLPFISYGGSSLVFNMMAVGVLLNISRQSSSS